MWLKKFAFLAVAVTTFSGIKNGVADRRHSILQLLSDVNKPPIVGLVYSKGDLRTQEGEEKMEMDLTEDLTPEIESLEPPHDKNAYMLYHVLRTTEETEDLDPEAARTLENTKDILRQALRKRCNKLKSCVQKCPKKFHLVCTIECKEQHDDYNVCEEKKSCNKPKCGKTMPPSWLLLRS